MCMFCAAIPVTAATGLAMDSKQSRVAQEKGRFVPWFRPYPLITAVALFLLMVGSVLFHLKFSKI
jgi:hypothetical protein